MVVLSSHPLAVLAMAVLLLSSLPGMGEAKASHFVVVHGASHEAWSWYKVFTLLRSWGHDVTALDMAASGVDPRQPKTVSSVYQYFEPLMEFMAALPCGERVVLVAHSFAGLGVVVAMEDFPLKISVAVFVAAAMPGPSLTVSSIHIQDLTLATTLVRPFPLFPTNGSEFQFTTERYGFVKRAYVILIPSRDIFPTASQLVLVVD